MILKLKNKSCTALKLSVSTSSVILEDVDIDNILLSNKISFGEKSYKYLIDYLCDDYENKPS